MTRWRRDTPDDPERPDPGPGRFDAHDAGDRAVGTEDLDAFKGPVVGDHGIARQGSDEAQEAVLSGSLSIASRPPDEGAVAVVAAQFAIRPFADHDVAVAQARDADHAVQQVFVRSVDRADLEQRLLGDGPAFSRGPQRCQRGGDGDAGRIGPDRDPGLGGVAGAEREDRGAREGAAGGVPKWGT